MMNRRDSQINQIYLGMWKVGFIDMDPLGGGGCPHDQAGNVEFCAKVCFLSCQGSPGLHGPVAALTEPVSRLQLPP